MEFQSEPEGYGVMRELSLYGEKLYLNCGNCTLQVHLVCFQLLSEHNCPCLCLRISWATCKVQMVGCKPRAVISQDGEGVMTVDGGSRDRSESHFLKIL